MLCYGGVPTGDWRANPWTTRGSSLRLVLEITQEVHETMQSCNQVALLPPCMVPQSINILEKMPVDEDRKVDRKGLAATAQRPKVSHGSVRKPETNAKWQVQLIWSRVLGIQRTPVGLDDRFFHLGSNSIATMKLVADTRKVGIELTVANSLFRHDRLSELARKDFESKPSNQEVDDAIHVNTKTKASLIEEIGSLNLGVCCDNVADILPLTSF